MKRSQVALLMAFPILTQIVSIVEIFTEKGDDRVDDIVFFGLALLGLTVIAALRRRPPVFIPVVLFALAVAIKMVSVFIEHGDEGAVGPDYLILLFMALGVAVSGVVRKRRGTGETVIPKQNRQ